MSDFRQLSDTVWASPQIGSDDIAAAKALGITMIVNNRPDGESDDQPEGATIAAEAAAAGMAYRAIPVTHAGIQPSQVGEMAQALAEAEGPVLAFCRSGTRSTFLWSLVQASKGMDPDQIAAAAAGAGYDVGSIRPAIEMFAQQAKAED
ncbi:TIGR01244 family sulfur transferase [Alteraurantiacibacter aestuarii]|uniref:TIGR01244 family phosphatase n=1 Tax=Alteraurantiacibacter aestuarii TaxID=650004 RepID=A0A844ZN94_9SPHN|nr:TIGR01244 family sulfur transferase [Alteraurantiacibacter aestuarii]MXO87119.1 TIGR01244 family phosphatase [Alteraurantiacibacter aestuarii]